MFRKAYTYNNKLLVNSFLAGIQYHVLYLLLLENKRETHLSDKVFWLLAVRGLSSDTTVWILRFFLAGDGDTDSSSRTGLLVPLCALWLLIQWSTMRLAATNHKNNFMSSIGLTLHMYLPAKKSQNVTWWIKSSSLPGKSTSPRQGWIQEIQKEGAEDVVLRV